MERTPDPRQRFLRPGHGSESVLASRVLAFAVALVLLAGGSVLAQADWYVTSSGNDSNDGETWGTAFATIQKAVNRAVQAGQYEIWVAKGTYVLSAPISIPSTGTKIPLKLYAGFAGDESSLTQRDWVTNATIIDGNNAVESVITVNQWVDLIDGFTITGGTLGSLGTGGGIDIRGCGNLSPQPVLRNLLIRGNGGDTSHPPAYYDGGGIYIEDCSPWIINTTFSNNRVWAHGGALFARDTAGTPVDTYPKVINSTFTANHSDVNGGAVGISGGTLTIANSILWGDSAGDGATHEVYGGTLSISYSDIDPAQPGYAGVNGNVQVDPRIAGIGRYHLREGSPCIDSGSDTLWTTFTDGFEQDFDGDDRFLDGGSGLPTIDMGADEYVPGATRLLHVDGVSGSDSNSGLSWGNAMATVQTAVAAAAGFDAEIWVKQGTYTLASSIVLTPANMNLGVYGGFAGTEILRDQRSSDATLTVLDGQNAYSCFSLDWTSQPGATGNIVIDGFTLDRGNHAVTLDSVHGTLIRNCRMTNATVDGAIYASASDLTVSNSYFSGNRAVYRAGAIHMNSASERLTVTDSVFIGNSAMIDGGSLSGCGGAIKASTGTVERSIFLANTADRHGGAIYDYGLADGLLVRNSLFSGNQAGLDYFAGTGGGIYGPVQIVNSTFSGNSAVVGAGGAYGATSITNSILWGNIGSAPVENFNYNCVQGRALYSDIGDASYSDVTTCQTPYGNINADPLFADADGADNTVGTTDDDLTLLASAPALDAGNSLALAVGSLDLAGSSRHNDDPAVTDTGYGPPPMIDMGAYERQASAPAADYDLTMQAVGEGTTAPLVGVHNYPAGSVVTVNATA
ncbi:MAG: right-handed parallel beta-helix repeat-containing protein, partial [Acidimicrobiia bacterium]|nr:right-handed parallel beta-helix repeat-containing protein [Acidimicrobiia bacterium]